jgi:hypothetical protein
LDPSIHIPRGKRGSPGAKSTQGFGPSSKAAHSEDRDGGAGPREADDDQKWMNDGLEGCKDAAEESDPRPSAGPKWHMFLRQLKELLNNDTTGGREGSTAWSRELELLSAATDAVKEVCMCRVFLVFPSVRTDQPLLVRAWGRSDLRSNAIIASEHHRQTCHVLWCCFIPHASAGFVMTRRTGSWQTLPLFPRGMIYSPNCNHVPGVLTYVACFWRTV